MSERDRGDRPKRTWREKDQARERGGASSSRTDDRRAPNADRASSEYKAQLDALFAKGGLAKLAEVMQNRGGGTTPAPAPASPTEGDADPRAAAAAPAVAAPAAPAAPAKDDGRLLLRTKILEALGRDEISRAVDRYLKQAGELPDDFEVLEQALEHTKAERVIDVLARLGKILQARQPKRSRTLAGKLRLLAETSSDDDVRQKANEVRPLLK